MKTKTTLERTIITAIGGLLFLGSITAGISAIGNQTIFQTTVQAQEAEESKSHARGGNPPFCNNSNLTGRYAVIGEGFAAPQPAPLLPFATVSLMTLDGAGNLTNKVTRSNNGHISRSVDSGTYNVNADCTGTITIMVPNPPFQLTFDLVVAELRAGQSEEFYFIATTPGGAITGAAKRIQ